MAKSTPKTPDPFDPETMKRAHRALRLCTQKGLELREGVSYYFRLYNQTLPELSERQCEKLALQHPYTFASLTGLFTKDHTGE